MDVNNKILSDITVHMKYSRYLPEKNRRETFEEVITRNKEMHIRKFPFLEKQIEEVYKLVYERKVLPSMRSLQFGGKAIKANNARMYNCCFLHVDDPKAFSEALFLLLGGTGVGYSVQWHHVAKLPPVMKPRWERTFVIPDSIEGWAYSIQALVEAYFRGGPKPIFDYSQIREKGQMLITSGGKAPGAAPLKECIRNVTKVLDGAVGRALRPIEAHDIICHLADAVLSGGIRRAALISLFSPDDQEMLTCKSGGMVKAEPTGNVFQKLWQKIRPKYVHKPFWEENAHRSRANNSAVLLRSDTTKEEFMAIMDAAENSGAGEPGILWTNSTEWGTNPCAEIALRNMQFCNLTEINASNIEDQYDLENRVMAATFIGTLQASYTDFHFLRDQWREVTESEALLGVSMTGLASLSPNLDLTKAAAVAKKTNAYVANLLGIKTAARITTVKPAGTTSLVLGTSSGIHSWHSPYFIRRIRVNKNEAIYEYLSKNHPELIEDEFFNPTQTAVISIPVKAPEGSITRSEDMVSFLNRITDVSLKWVMRGHNFGLNTHNVSATVSVKEGEWEMLKEWMWDFKDYYNGISVLPYDGHVYIQAPFEEIDEQKFNEMSSVLRNIDLSNVVEYDDSTNLIDQAACAGGSCEIV